MMEIGGNSGMSIQGPTNKDLEALKFEVGTIVEAINLDEKYIKIKADFGSRVLDCIPDIRNSVSASDIRGKKFIFFTNEEPQIVQGHKNECRIMLAWNYENNRKYITDVDISTPNGTRVAYKSPPPSIFDSISQPPSIKIEENLPILTKGDNTIYRVTPFLNFSKNTGILEAFIFSCYHYPILLAGSEFARADLKGLSFRAYPDL